MSIFSCPAPYFSLASGWFWTFLRFFCALCPFSPARLSLASGWFWTFYCFSRLYVHFQLLSSVFPSGFRMILDFFTAFLGFMSILNCSVPYCLWLPDNFGLFYCFSRLYVHFLLLSSVFPSGFRRILDFSLVFLSFISIWKSIEVSGLRKVRKSPDCDEHGSHRTA